MSKTGKGFRLLLISVVLLTAMPALARDNQQYWSWYMFNLYQKSKFKFSTYAEFRLQNDLNQPKLTLVSPKLYYRAFNNLTFVASYTYMNVLRSAPVGDDDYRFQHRLELEADPSFAITGWLNFKNRNRIEIRWLESLQGISNRMRNRFELQLKTAGLGFVKGFYANSEFFIDFRANAYNQNRFIPIGVTTQIARGVKFRIYFMQQYLKGPATWQVNNIIGTFLILNF